MTPEKVRLGVAGLGRIGWDFHCWESHRHPQFELAAVADPEAPRRRHRREDR